MSKVDYKKIYSENMNGLKWDSNQYDVHHIDLNRSNNDFENLVLVPKRLHRKFHFFYNSIKDVDFSNLSCIHSQSSHTLQSLSDFFEVKEEMLQMLLLKNQLTIPSVLGYKDDFDLILSSCKNGIYSKYIRTC